MYGYERKGKAVVSRQEAYARVQAAVDARNEGASFNTLTWPFLVSAMV